MGLLRLLSRRNLSSGPRRGFARHGFGGFKTDVNRKAFFAKLIGASRINNRGFFGVKRFRNRASSGFLGRRVGQLIRRRMMR